MLELITQLSAEIAEMHLLADEADDQLMVEAFAMNQLIDGLQLLHDRLLDEPRYLSARCLGGTNGSNLAKMAGALGACRR